jgi:hypothetical protein
VAPFEPPKNDRGEYMEPGLNLPGNDLLTPAPLDPHTDPADTHLVSDALIAQVDDIPIDESTFENLDEQLRHWVAVKKSTKTPHPSVLGRIDALLAARSRLRRQLNAMRDRDRERDSTKSSA